jgi:hypothetical protein
MTTDPLTSAIEKVAKASEETGKIMGRIEFEGCIAELDATRSLMTASDYNKGWNDATDHAIRFISKYMNEEGLFQTKKTAVSLKVKP